MASKKCSKILRLNRKHFGIYCVLYDLDDVWCDRYSYQKNAVI
jgi:hypothetical protein